MLPERNGAQPRARILVLDDEPTILMLLTRILEQAGYEVLTATSGAAALATLTAHHERVALIVVDVKLPDMSGREFVRHAIARFGRIRTLYVSGVDQRGHSDVVNEDSGFLAKPFDARELTSRIHTLLSGPDEGLLQQE